MHCCRVIYISFIIMKKIYFLIFALFYINLSAQDCKLFELDFKKLDCDSNKYFQVKINFAYKNTSSCFKINGDPIVELDFQAFHTKMLYNMEGINYQRDPYQVAADSYKFKTYRKRKYFKLIGLMAINAPTKTATIRAVITDLKTHKINIRKSHIKKCFFEIKHCRDSSAGRTSHSHCEDRRFDSGWVHVNIFGPVA